MTRKNNYMGEDCYLPSLGGEDIIEKKVDVIIDAYFNDFKYHFTFNDFFEEFFEITKVNLTSFNKEKGLDFYRMPSNNHLMMIYTLEQFQVNSEEVCRALGMSKMTHFSNDGNEKFYAEQYKKVKETICYKKSYLDALLDTYIMRFFYTKEQVDSFYKLYDPKFEKGGTTWAIFYTPRRGTP